MVLSGGSLWRRPPLQTHMAGCGCCGCCCYRATSGCVSSGQSSGRSLSRTSRRWRASCRCACACGRWGCRSGGRPCYRWSICTASPRCASACGSCSFLRRENKGTSEKRGESEQVNKITKWASIRKWSSNAAPLAAPGRSSWLSPNNHRLDVGVKKLSNFIRVKRNQRRAELSGGLPADPEQTLLVEGGSLSGRDMSSLHGLEPASH